MYSWMRVIKCSFWSFSYENYCNCHCNVDRDVFESSCVENKNEWLRWMRAEIRGSKGISWSGVWIRCEKMISIWTSPVVTHPSTIQTWRCLTSQIGRDAVRQRNMADHARIRSKRYLYIKLFKNAVKYLVFPNITRGRDIILVGIRVIFSAATS